MKVGQADSRTAPWLVVSCAAALLGFPQTPAIAASSETLPGPVGELLQEAAPGIKARDVDRFWFSNAGVINVIANVGGRPREFKISAAAELLWVGEPGEGNAILPNAIDGALEMSFEDLPQLVRLRVLNLVPDFIPIKIVIRGGARRPYYQISGDSARGNVHFTIKSDGVITAFDTDRDRDGLPDAFELARGWNPEMADTDSDGFPDRFEFEHRGDPSSAAMTPEFLSVALDRESNVLLATVQTFEDAAFYIEAQTPGTDEWLRIGEAVRGNGAPQEFAVPLGGPGSPAGLIRAGVTDPADGADIGADLPDSGSTCSVPTTLVGHQLTVGGGRRLCFKWKTRGEEIQGSGGGMLVTPFGYIFKRSGHCKARLTLTFNTGNGFETTIYTLTFGADGRPSGAFVASRFEGGAEENRFDGSFTLSMNP